MNTSAHVPIIKPTACPTVDVLRKDFSLVFTSMVPAPPGIVGKFGVAIGFTECGYLGRIVRSSEGDVIDSSGARAGRIASAMHGREVALEDPFIFQYEIGATGDEQGRRSVSPQYFLFPCAFATDTISVVPRAISALSALPDGVVKDLRERLIPAWDGAKLIRGRNKVVTL